MLTADSIRNKYLNFFKSKGHAIIPSASLIPENDPTVLFTTAGMHPLVPYLLGEKHPAGRRLTDVQKCLRTGDIESVGDATHCTFLEMLGNWSLGDYFKDESITWSYEFLTDPEYLNIDKERLFFTVFEGDADAPKDMETYNKWRSLGVAEDHLFFLPKEHNWWGPAGLTGPCGPDTEIFYDTGKPECGPECGPACSCGKYVEIWNNVFMEYNKKADGTFEPLSQKNVDTGMGLERLFSTLLQAESVYDTELFQDTVKELERLSGKSYRSEYLQSFRIVADHLRTAVFVLGDEKCVVPSNVEQGYILRRIIRRLIRHLRKLGVSADALGSLAELVIGRYGKWYTELEEKREFILKELEKEEALFSRTIEKGIKEFNNLIQKMNGTVINGDAAFRLFDTFGFPLEFTQELAAENNLTVDEEAYQKAYQLHQEKSRSGAEQKFKGGLADHSDLTTRLHSATHLLHAALREMFGTTVEQRGSNITADRLRFDFSFDRKLTPEEVKSIEEKVNDVISENIPVEMREMSLQEALDSGAVGIFKNRYNSELVKTYRFGSFSFEVCGGPHVQSTSEMGRFVIDKQESSSAGVRRIKAHLE